MHRWRRMGRLVIGVLSAAAAVSSCRGADESPAPDAGERPEFMIGGGRCKTSSDCKPWMVCRFTEPGCGDIQGWCGQVDPPCSAPHPFCACDGSTVRVCAKPTTKWTSAGACEAGS